MELFVGLDVSLNSIAICVLSSRGKVHKETTSACEPDDLIAFLRTLQGDVACIGLRINKRTAKRATKKDRLLLGPPLIPVCQLQVGQCT